MNNSKNMINGIIIFFCILIIIKQCSDYQNIEYKYKKQQNELNKYKKTPEKLIKNEQKLSKNNGKEEENKLDKIEPNRNIKTDVLALKFEKFTVGNTYIVDRYDERYHYYTAERDQKYIVSNVMIKSKIKEPCLPEISAFIMENGEFVRICIFEYHFYSWQDYGYYLGNYEDKNNDFRYTENIKFSIGCTILTERIKGKKIYIILNDCSGYTRMYDVFRTPKTYYSGSGDTPRTLSINSIPANYYIVDIIKN